MNKNITRIALVVIALCFVFTAVSYSEEGQTTGQKAKTFWQKLFNYPANATDKSVKVVTNVGERGTSVVTNEVKTVGKVTSGEFDKAKDLVVEPVKGTADATAKAVQETAAIPADSAKQ